MCRLISDTKLSSAILVLTAGSMHTSKVNFITNIASEQTETVITAVRSFARYLGSTIVGEMHFASWQSAPMCRTLL